MKAQIFLSGGLLLASLAFTTTSVATGNPWYDQFKNYDDTRGTTYTGKADAALIAWQESMMLRSYLNLYTATKNADWLDKFTVHADAIMGSLNNLDGDAYRDWTTGRYSPPIVVNGLFGTGATGITDTQPANWMRSGTTPDTNGFRTDVSGEYISSCSGDHWGYKLLTNGSTPQQVTQTLTYVPGWKYQLSIYGKNSHADVAGGPNLHGRVYVYDHTDNRELASVEVLTNSWANYSVDFDMPAAATPSNHVVRVWMAHDGTLAGRYTLFDNVRVAPHYAYHVLDGMTGIPLANFIRLIRQTPALQGGDLEDAADDYQTYLETEMIPKWQDSAGFYGDTWVNASATEGYYKEPTTRDTFENAASFDPLPYNQSFALLEVQNILYDVHTSPTIPAYRDRPQKSAQHFANRLTMPSGFSAYTWKYAAFSGAKVEDASHANVDMEFITEMNRAGSVFTNTDMARFTNTLTQIMWDGPSPQLWNHVDGTPGSYCTGDYLFSRLMYGWIPYARFSADVWKIAAAQYGPTTPANNHTEAVTLSQLILWDPVKLVNQGFELASQTDPALPARWTRSLSTALTAYRDSANKTSGDWGLTLISNGTTYQRLVQSWENYVGGASYTVTFDGKTDTSGAGGRILVYDVTTSTILGYKNFSNTTWQTQSFTFTAPANGTDVVNVQIGHLTYTVNNGVTSYDNVVIKRTGDAW